MQKILRHPTFFFVFTTICLLLSLSLLRSGQTHKISDDRIQTLEQEIEKITVENARIGDELAQAQSPLAKEKIIRNELLQQKNGEYVVQIAQDRKYVPPPTVVTGPPSPWEEWKTILF